MTELKSLKFFATGTHPCSYLDEEATTLFVDPDITPAPELYNQLSQLGFRRSGDHLYRPHCDNCNACIPTRINVNDFQASRSQKRIWKKNQDLSIHTASNNYNPEHYAIYEKYLNARHEGGDMHPPSDEQYQNFLNSSWANTFFYEFRQGDKLLAVAVVDWLEDGISAVYTYYDPDEEKRSLGSFAILWQINLLKQHKLPHLYLGYWIKECSKMSYKIKFRPIELFINQRWQNLK